MLNVSGWTCVVIGAGPVGTRRAQALAESGADVTLVDPEAPESLEGVKCLRRGFEPDMLTGARLVLACTDDAQVNGSVAAAARENGALVNRSDDPDSSDFHVPMRLKDGPVVVAISTGGASPSLGKRIRDSLTLPAGIGEYAQLLLELRHRAAREIPDGDLRADVMRQLSTDDAFMLFLAQGPESLKTLYENQRKRNPASDDAL